MPATTHGMLRPARQSNRAAAGSPHTDTNFPATDSGGVGSHPTDRSSRPPGPPGARGDGLSLAAGNRGRSDRAKTLGAAHGPSSVRAARPASGAFPDRAESVAPLEGAW